MDWAALLNITPYSWDAIGTALFCGTLVGLERQMRGKPVGIRTSSLITLGTYLFIVGAGSIMTDATDPSRIIGQVITGIGFLGAGVMLARDGIVVGVTSAATIWVLASVGVAIGLGHLAVAMKLSVVVVGVLFGVDILEDYFQSLTRGVHHKYKGWKKSIRKDKQG
ncbi:MgtC/SapB family protein [Pseudidiomarina terrestris]|uniref:MgtC/SapB family protein n=1 Tax=Pseudidiomarina terrestris TaxID=2820060 RepID=UPI0026532D66|nr:MULTISPECIES: MgtC/SapB family protein [unclassified Pseudidiomarina]MDN7125881.1 MgtC/SapB family protein [Pseudidiomarina sp. 1APR75-33.1]MDN7136513.1 MgtC/SapB family protein [Pseudidiomarina sp. 1ASP75-5]MEA3588189.1 MgtC/SapB family protein [Pseudidiomarina sp. 1APP75-27a]